MLIAAASGAERDQAARGFLRGRSPRAPLLIVANSLEAGQRLLGEAVTESPAGALFGWQVESLATLTGKLAGNALAAAGLTPASGFALEALCARLVFELAQRAELGRFARVADRPGLPRALARTLSELALAGVVCDAPTLDPDLARVYERYRAALAQAQLADPARVLEIAAEVARAGAHALCGLPTLLWDLRVAERAECDLLTAFAAHASERLATAHAHDARSLAFLEQALGARAQPSAIDPARAAKSALYRLQQQLFAPPRFGGELGSEVALLSAPGEGRECVEIARRALQEAERGMRFDRMAILLRAPELYRVPLTEALRRARIPAHFTRGTLQPDRSGRALLALLACAGEELSARRFAEYLSLGVVPRRDPSGAPPAAVPSGQAFVPPAADALEGALVGSASAEEPGDGTDEPRVAADELPAPRRWERLLISAAVLSGKARWRVRLDALEHELRLKLASETALDESRRAAVERELGALRSLRAFALPLIDALSELPAQARWGEWIEILCALATRAIAEPAGLLDSLRELAPMAEVGPLGLGEVRLVLERRLGEQLVRASATPAGKLLVAGIDEVRGLAFDLVFVPGLAEKIFPKKLNEDPLLLDAARASVSPDLATAAARIAGERAALQLAVSAARERVVLSFPRFAADRARPRVPSFYALEVLRAAEGELPTQGELQQRATEAADARMGWPAPATARDAIDAAEYDLVVLHGFLHGTTTDWSGAANYLLECNPHLGRALRFRARRWHSKWHKADGLVLQQPDDALRDLLKAQLPSERAYSATALERYAACPYRFYLSAIVGLRKRDEPEAIESMPANERGMLVHAVLRALLHELRTTDDLPVTDQNLAQAQARLDLVLPRVAAEYRERLAPAIARVWDEGVAEIRADLRKWLVLAAERPDWTPAYFELAFGLPERDELESDPASRAAGVRLGAGLLLKGSVDLVERSGEVLRAVDYKTGVAPTGHYLAIDGGRALQPVLYALALEQLFPGSEVRAGEAYYCSARGGWKRIEVVLDPRARGSVQTFVTTLEQAIAEGFLPAAPARDACERCEFSPICGPYEAQRVSHKERKRLEPLKLLRSEP